MVRSDDVNSPYDAVAVCASNLQGQTFDHLEKLTCYGRKRGHNLKYFTWVERQGEIFTEIQVQWRQEKYWEHIPASVEQIDAFNKRTKLLKELYLQML